VADQKPLQMMKAILLPAKSMFVIRMISFGLKNKYADEFLRSFAMVYFERIYPE
jgi:hypothetical protein